MPTTDSNAGQKLTAWGRQAIFPHNSRHLGILFAQRTLQVIIMESPNTQTRPKVLITGVNGFIAAQVAAAFLRAGYSVRGSYWSRNPVPGQLLDALYKEIPDGKDHEPSLVEVMEVEDITRPGSFDEAVKDQSIPASSLSQPIYSSVWLGQKEVADISPKSQESLLSATLLRPYHSNSPTLSL